MVVEYAAVTVGSGAGAALTGSVAIKPGMTMATPSTIPVREPSPNLCPDGLP
jgi:hypothetical protein